MTQAKTCAIQKILLIFNEAKERVRQQLPVLMAACQTEGLQVSSHPLDSLGNIKVPTCDAIVSVGGDGTLLSTARYAHNMNKPLLGINCGHLGFLTPYAVQDFIQALPHLHQGLYKTTRRYLIQAQDASKSTFYALNDIVIKSKALRLVPLSVYINEGICVTRTRSDGMIFCTATGSTAYNLSASGPVLHPTSRMWCMTPICPHDFFNRTLVFDHTTTLRIESEDDTEIVTDGKRMPDKRLPLILHIAKKIVTFIKPDHFSFFENLRSKFNW